MAKPRGWKIKPAEKDQESGSESGSASESEVEILKEEEDENNVKRLQIRGKRSNNDNVAKTEECEPSAPVSCRSKIRKMMIAQKGINWKNMEQVTLRHPKTGHKALFLLDTQIPSGESKQTSNNKSVNYLYEIMTMEQESRSWFVDDSVVSDGNSYVCTLIDPLFLVIPILKKSSQAKPLRDHLSESIASSRIADILCAHLLQSTQLENIAVKKVCDDIVAFKYSEDDVLKWLSEKVDKSLKFLSERRISSTEASISSNFTKSSNGTSNGDQQEYLRYACEIVGEYLDEELKKKLFEKFGLPVEKTTCSNKRKSEIDSVGFEDGQTKKAKVENGSSGVMPLEDYGSSNNTSTSASTMSTKSKTKEKEFQKAAKGSHSLFKFFTPKGK